MNRTPSPPHDTPEAASDRSGATVLPFRRPEPPASRPKALPWGALLATLLVSTLPGILEAQTGSRLPALLREAGIQAVSPPTPALALDLPSLDGGRQSLEDYRGRWVLLTFFATWCGPCRAEMPSLQRLHDALEPRGLSVLGVSVDRRQDAVPPFLRRLGVSFPTLWDEKGAAGRGYRASSIPLTYVIDPRGQIVGFARGARDWHVLQPTFEAVLALDAEGSPEAGTEIAAVTETDAGQGADGVDPAEGTQLPTTFAPPTASVEVSDLSPRVGAPFRLDVRIRWSGAFDQYLLLPPALELPQGVRQLGFSALTSSESGDTVLTYRMELTADEAGRFALDPIEVRYRPRGEEIPVASRVPGPTVEARPFTILGIAPRMAAASLGATGALAMVAWAVWRRRSRGSANEPGEATTLKEARRLLDGARRLRLDGREAEALEALVAAGRLVDEPLDEDPAVTGALEKARYGGTAPAAGQLDLLQRRLARRLEALRPDPDRTLRRDLELDGSAAADGLGIAFGEETPR